MAKEANAMNSLAQDLRYSGRMLRKNPGFTAIAVLTLALGIGANTALFGVIDAVLLRPLPYPSSNRLAALGENKPCCRFSPLSAGNFLDYQARVKSFENLTAFVSRSFTLAEGATPVMLRGQVVSVNFFDTLGVSSALGRTFNRALDLAGGPRAAVLSYGAWRTRFAGDAAAIGRALILSGEPFTVVGVMPASFQAPQAAEIWVSPRYSAPEWASDARPEAMRDYGRNYLIALGRLRRGISVDQANAELRVVSRQLEQEHPQANAKKIAVAVALLDWSVGNIRPALWTMLGAVALTLLIACANLANLLLARGTVRQRELAIRASIGASRMRLIRQLVTETVVLSLLGGGVGILLALWGGRLARLVQPGSLPRASEIQAYPEVFVFALSLALITGLLTGIAPALRLAGTDLTQLLKTSGRGGSSSGGRRVRQALVAAEVCLSLALLVGAGLLGRSFSQLLHVDPGFDPGGVLAADLVLPKAKYDRKVKMDAFWTELRTRAAELPGVSEVGLIDSLPFNSGGASGDILFADRPKPRPGEIVTAEMRTVSAGYFETLRIPLKRGRTFSNSDDGRQPVVIINENMARYAWPHQDAIGQRISWGEGEPWMTVVGVVGNVHQYALNRASGLETYAPFQQYPLPVMTLAVRAQRDPGALAGPLREIVRSLDSVQPVANISLLSELVASSYAQRRFQMLLLGSLAALALLLAGIGIYGVVSYAVQQRTAEIGLRLALGAGGWNLLGLVLGGVLRMALLGACGGVVLSLLLGRVMRSLLFGVSSTDPLVYVGASAALIGLSLAAGYVPARRVMRIDPVIALRHD
jgi:putative ABC transport system permease protein